MTQHAQPSIRSIEQHPTAVAGQSRPEAPESFNFNTRNRFDPARFRGVPKQFHDPSVVRGRFGPNVPRTEDGFRVGYWQHDRRFLRNFFFFSQYVFWPFDACVFSPWYFYPALPPYLATEVVVFSTSPSYGSYYPYRWYTASANRDWTSIDYAIGDITAAFNEHDPRACSRLIPTDGDVAIYLDGNYHYNVRAGDFAEMLHDAISDVQTTRYRVLSTRRYDDGSYWFEAQHDMLDPSGANATVYQTFRLVSEGGVYVIREFGTSQSQRL